MHNTISGFGVDHNRFTLASSAHSQKQSFQKKKNFITITRLGLNCFKYLGPKFWSNVPETLENLKKDFLK